MILVSGLRDYLIDHIVTSASTSKDMRFIYTQPPTK